MFEANLKIIEELKSFVGIVKNNPDLIKQIATTPNAFTRKRKLTFDRLVLIIARLCKKTLSVELEKFFEEMNMEMPCSVSAFTQHRMKLAPEFFLIWNKVFTASFYHYYGTDVKRWNGYRLIACDGSKISLVNTPLLHNYFGGQSNQWQSFVQANAFYCYDVLNEVIVHARIAPYRTSELSMAYARVDSYERDMLVIYDRLYSNFKMVALHQWQETEIKFVIRALDSIKQIKDFIRSGKSSDTIYLKSTPSAQEGLEQNGYKIDKTTLVKVRLVRVELENSIEVLMTNLWEEEGYDTADFKQLYFQRWGVETNISLQKNILQLESFSGQTPLSVQQDFYATVFMSNLFSLITKQAQQEIDKTVFRKYPVKVNRNKSYAKLRSNLVSLFTSNHPEVILQKLYKYFIRDPLPVRKNRSFPRIRKNKQSNSKFKTYHNFKPAY